MQRLSLQGTVRFTLSFPKEEMVALRQCAKAEGCAVSELIRMAVGGWLGSAEEAQGAIYKHKTYGYKGRVSKDGEVSIEGPIVEDVEEFPKFSNVPKEILEMVSAKPSFPEGHPPGHLCDECKIARGEHVGPLPKPHETSAKGKKK